MLNIGKIKSLLGKETPDINPGNIDISEATTATNDFMQQEEVVREFADDPTPDPEIISTIENIYFSDLDFDASLHELEKLPEELSEGELDSYRNNLRRQLQAVSRQLSQKILDNQRAYVQGLDRVMELESNLQKATKTCKSGRRKLAEAEKAIAVNALQLLAKNRRKVLLENLSKSLRFIKTLQQTDLRLKELLQLKSAMPTCLFAGFELTHRDSGKTEQNYASAIQLCLECQQAAITFHQYYCISELSSNLQEILEQIEEHLDNALSKVCMTFNQESYGKIQEAYTLLEKSQIAMDQLQMHFLNTINTVAHSCLVKAATGDDLSFNSMCQKVPFEEFIPCLLDLCKEFWSIMFNYRHVMKWHEENQPVNNKDTYVKSKLDQGIVRIWQDVQQKIKTFVLSANFAYFKYDDFIKVLDIINRLICIGENFSKSESAALQESIQVQTINYFKAYHKTTLEELKMFLENEAWEMCPVKNSFRIFHLQEFCFMKTQLLVRASSTDMLSEKDFFEECNYTHEKTPFHNIHTENDESSVMERKNTYYDEYEDDDDDEEEDIPDELKQDFVDENTGEEAPKQSKKNQKKKETFTEDTLIVTNTTLNLLRSFGKYMQMMNVLKPIAYDVVLCMSQLFDYYMYSVFTFFGLKDMKIEDGILKLVDGKLKSCLHRIHNTFLSQEVMTPNLSFMVDLSSEGSLRGFRHRIIGVESLSFLASQLRLVYKNLENLIPHNKSPFLSQFFSQTVDVAGELRLPIFQIVGEKAIKYEKILQMMTPVRWDPKEIMSQHNPYVDALVQEFQELDKKIKQMKSIVPVPIASSQSLWISVISKTNHLLVDGYATAKKCSNEGRAWMLLDFQQFLMKVDKITNIKPIPEREYVENFIKAFYLSESILEQWLSEHQEYSPKQLNNLVTCGTGSHIGKKMRQKLLGLIDEIDSKYKSSASASSSISHDIR